MIISIMCSYSIHSQTNKSAKVEIDTDINNLYEFNEKDKKEILDFIIKKSMSARDGDPFEHIGRISTITSTASTSSTTSASVFTTTEFTTSTASPTTTSTSTTTN